MNNVEWAINTAAAAIIAKEEQVNLLEHEQEYIEKRILENPNNLEVIRNGLMRMRFMGEYVGKQDGIIETCQTIGYSDPYMGPKNYTNAVKAECERMRNIPGC